MDYYMKIYSNDLYQEDNIYEITGVFPARPSELPESSYYFRNSYQYAIKYKKRGYNSVAYIYESMIAPADCEPLTTEYDTIYSGTKNYKVYRPIGKQGLNELYCVEQNGILTTKFGYHLDL